MKIVSLKVSKAPLEEIEFWLKENIGEKNVRYWVNEKVITWNGETTIRSNIYHFDFEEDATAFYLRFVGVEE